MVEAQNIDCNCNNCFFMVRDMEKFKASLEQHKKWQLTYFNTLKDNLLDKAAWWQNKKNLNYDFEKGIRLRKEANKMRFQFNKKEVSINYGSCSKKDIAISWVPNTCQLDTQECFKNRREQ